MRRALSSVTSLGKGMRTCFNVTIARPSVLGNFSSICNQNDITARRSNRLGKLTRLKDESSFISGSNLVFCKPSHISSLSCCGSLGKIVEPEGKNGSFFKLSNELVQDHFLLVLPAQGRQRAGQSQPSDVGFLSLISFRSLSSCSASPSAI